MANSTSPALNRRFITVHNAREKNLKNISLQIPKERFVVLTGPSGSGKTTLAFSVLYAEGRRRYVESLSAYARQFLGSSEKPDVDQITGLTPAIAIEQKTVSKNPRSTVGTVTEIYDYLRLLYARIGTPYCINGHGKITASTIKQIIRQINNTLPSKTAIKVYAPVAINQKGQFQMLFQKWKKAGFYEVLVDKKIFNLDQTIPLVKNEKHTILLLIDAFTFEKSQTDNTRLAAALETAVEYGKGFVHLYRNGQTPLIYAQNFSCSVCGYSVPDMEPRFFSFNALLGACQECKGLGTVLSVSVDSLIPNPNLSINQGGLVYYRSVIGTDSLDWIKLEALCDYYNIDRDLPVGELSAQQMERIFYGSDVPISYGYARSDTGHQWNWTRKVEGLFDMIKRRYFQRKEYNDFQETSKKYLVDQVCSICNGQRLNQNALAVKIAKLNISEFTALSIRDALQIIKTLDLSDSQRQIANLIIQEIQNRLQFLGDVGLDYLTLSRAAATLSGGEAQRIRLATQIGTQLTGVLYVLDEPSIGLHQYDNLKLLKTLRAIVELGNTVLVVEHDLETITYADYLVDLGPFAGSYGGEVIASGSVQDVQADRRSLTGQFLNGQRQIPVPRSRRIEATKSIQIQGATANNLANIDVAIPTKRLVCITGLSGSGKSTLVNNVLYRNLKKQLNPYETKSAGPIKALINETDVQKVVLISQDPIGKTPRSNPATYTGVFADIREVFAQTPTAQARGYKIGRFSFNVKEGRCFKCSGDGVISHSMLFLPDVNVVCSECEGKRFNPETLAIKYKGKTIADVLEMEIHTALTFFAPHIKIRRKLQTLVDVGLSYLRLGQRSTELSGGEAQRIKLASFLGRRQDHTETMYILDEPTTGLHVYDVGVLLKTLNYLVDQGSSIVLIEHNLDVIKTADYLIDLGPKGGNQGGQVLACGTPETIAANPRSYTGRFLREILPK